jgi:hypothetical protein
MCRIICEMHNLINYVSCNACHVNGNDYEENGKNCIDELKMHHE